MIIGIGIDLLEVPRMEKALDRSGPRLLDKLFTPEEQQVCREAGGGAQRWAVRFAAKEAVFKALGTGWSQGVGWHHVEILRSGAGVPQVRLSGGARQVADRLGAGRCHVSLTHQRSSAAAVAILESHQEASST